MEADAKPQYHLEAVSKIYQGPAEAVMVLDHISLDIQRGEQIAIVGASGSGKSTFLHLLGTLDTPTEGTILFEGSDISAMNDEEKACLRREKLGFVFQFHYLLPEFNTLENVAMQAIIAGTPKDEAFELAQKALKSVGLAQRTDFKVTLLSGGERQRAAIARAILRNPSVLLADEPTGNLDERNAASVSELMLELNEKLSMTLVVVTHNMDMARTMNRCLELKSGVLL